MRAWQRRARVWLWPMVMLLATALASCGGSASSRPQGASAGASATSAGTGGAPATTAGASGAATATAGAGGQLGDAGRGGASAGAGMGGRVTADDGGSAGDSPTAGTGGEPCVDVCELRGEACCVPGSCVSAEASCVIDVFSTQVTTTYEYSALEQRVATLPQTFSASISTADIVSSAADPSPAARIELHVSAAASLLNGEALERGELHPFRVSCGGQRLYVGLVYQLEGAAGLALPVLHVSRDADDSLILRLGAWQSAWAFPNPTDDNLVGRARLDRPELRATLCLNSAPQEL